MTQWIAPVALSSVMPRLREFAAAVRTWPPARGRDAPPQRHARRRAGARPRPQPPALARRHRHRVGGRWRRPSVPAAIRTARMERRPGARCCRSRTSASASRTARSPRSCSSRGSTPARPCRMRAWRSWTRRTGRGGAGTTDRDGVALAPALALREPTGPRDLSFIVTAEKDGDVAFVGSNWNGDLSPSRPDINYERRRVRRRAARKRVHRSRRVQGGGRGPRQGGAARRHAGRHAPACRPARALDVVVRDGRGREVDRRTVTVNRWSSAEWTWRVPAGAALGHYSIEMSRAGTLPSTGTHRTIVGDVSRRRVPPARLPRRRDADGRSRRCWARRSRARSRRSTSSAARSARGPSDGGSGASRFSSAPAAIRERYPEDRYAVGYLPGSDDRGDCRIRRLRRRPRCLAPMAARPCRVADVGRRGRRVLVHVRGRRRGRVRSAHRQSRRARRASGVALRRDVAAADVRRHEDRRDGRRRRRRSGRQSRRGRAGDRVAPPRGVGVRAPSGSPEADRLGAARDSGGRVDGPDGRRRDAAADSAARGRLLHPARDRARRERAGRRAPRSTSTRSGRACRRGGARATASISRRSARRGSRARRRAS